jgi:hypothetical protein
VDHGTTSTCPLSLLASRRTYTSSRPVFQTYLRQWRKTGRSPQRMQTHRRERLRLAASFIWSATSPTRYIRASCSPLTPTGRPGRQPNLHQDEGGTLRGAPKLHNQDCREVTAAPVLGLDYIATPRRVADRRMVLAAYRLADFLTRVVGQQRTNRKPNN